MIRGINTSRLFSSSVAVFSISLCWPTTLAVNGCFISVNPRNRLPSISLFMCCYDKFLFTGVGLITTATYISFMCFPLFCLTEYFLSLVLYVFKSAFASSLEHISANSSGWI